jgi:hypothetical protein
LGLSLNYLFKGARRKGKLERMMLTLETKFRWETSSLLKLIFALGWNEKGKIIGKWYSKKKTPNMNKRQDNKFIPMTLFAIIFLVRNQTWATK